jgi:basic membrane protein A and related proteins
VGSRFKAGLIFLLSLSLFLPFISSAESASKKIKIGIVYDVGGKGDKSFNDAAAIGVDAAKAKFGLSELDVREIVTSGNLFDRENRIEFLVKAKYDLVIAIGPAFAEAITYMSDKYPRRQFAIVGSPNVESLNVSSMAFSTQESAYLAGVMAALNSKSSKIGFLGDQTHPNNSTLLDNFKAGAKSAKKKIKVITRNPEPSANVEVSELSRSGVDVIFSTWSRSGSAVSALSKLAKAKKKIKLIGVRPEQYFLSGKEAQKVLIGYVNERYDKAIMDLFEATVAGDTLIEIVDGRKGVFGRKLNLANSGIELISTSANKKSKDALARATAGIISKVITVVK